jgi:O-antigen/teichoic acid export membrane protein
LSNIRVTYSGLINFVIGIISVFTGLIFTLTVTRRLPQDELGTWALIGSLLVYATIISPIIDYWLTREIARGKKSGKTGVISTGFFSVLGLTIFVILAYFVSLESDASFQILLFGCIIIPVLFLQKILHAINMAWKPETRSYGMLIFEVVKIPTGIFLIYFLDFGVIGAIITTFVAHLGEIILLIYYAREKIRVSFNKSFIKNWFKLSWIPMFANLQNLILYLDVIFFTLLTGSVTGLAFYAVSISVVAIVNHSSSLSFALYSKLLQGGKKEYLQQNLINVLYFALPLLTLSIVFSKPVLFALNPQYIDAWPIVIILGFKVFFHIIKDIFESGLYGIEKVDVNEKSTWKDFIKSKLFFLPTLRIIQNTLYIIILAIVLWIFVDQNVPDLHLVIYWAIVGLVIQIPFTIYTYYIAKKEFPIKIPKNSIIKFTITSIISIGISYSLFENFVEYNVSIFKFLPNLLLFVLIGMSMYITITYLIDSRTKKLVQSAIKEILKKN